MKKLVKTIVTLILVLGSSALFTGCATNGITCRPGPSSRPVIRQYPQQQPPFVLINVNGGSRGYGYNNHQYGSTQPKWRKVVY